MSSYCAWFSVPWRQPEHQHTTRSRVSGIIPPRWHHPPDRRFGGTYSPSPSAPVGNNDRRPRVSGIIPPRWHPPDRRFGGTYSPSPSAPVGNNDRRTLEGSINISQGPSLEQNQTVQTAMLATQFGGPDYGVTHKSDSVRTTLREKRQESMQPEILKLLQDESFTPLASISEVTESLLLCGAPAITPQKLRDFGVTCVVNAASELPDTPLPQDRHIAYLKVNVEDTPSSDLLAHMDKVADLIEEVRSAGGKTLVHCVAGVSRSATLCLAYLVKYERMPLRKAFAHLRSRRPSIRPNVGFFTQLIEFEKRHLGAATVNMVHNQAAGTIIPDVYESDYQNMLWYQQNYSRNLGRH